MIQTVANFIWGWGGIGSIAAIGAVVFASFSPVFKREAIMLAVVLAAATFIYGKGYRDGAIVIQAQWDAAVQAAIKRGEDARTGAERDVDAGGVSNDRFDRDKGPM